MQETRIRFLGQKDPLEQETAKSHEQRSLPGGHKESDMTEWLNHHQSIKWVKLNHNIKWVYVHYWIRTL